jgi:hypothetical protein
MGEKTTIEIDNIRELKQHALDTNKTLKQLINEAIWEKIQRERQQLGKGLLKPEKEPIKSNEGKVSEDNIAELKKTLSNAGLLSIVEKECRRHNIQLDNISPGTLTPKLMGDIRTSITLVFDDETAEQIIQKIETLIR